MSDPKSPALTRSDRGGVRSGAVFLVVFASVEDAPLDEELGGELGCEEFAGF